MKRISSLIVATVLIFSFAGCVSDKSVEKRDNPEDYLNNEIAVNQTANNEEFDGLEKFKEKLEESEVKLEETDMGDGNTVVEMTTPDEEEFKPAIPTIDKDKLPKPTPRPEVKPEPEPTPETEPTPEPEPTPETEPTPEPEPTPETEPTPEPEPTPALKPVTPAYTFTTGQKHTALKLQDRYLYTTLNAKNKENYRAIDKAVRKLEDGVAFNMNMVENRDYYIYFLYMCDNPELWYLGNTMSICSNLDGTSRIDFSYTDGVNYNAYGHNPRYLTEELKQSILDKDAVFKAEVERIISTIPADAPDAWKERLIYDRILMDSDYNLGAEFRGIGPDDWTAYGILVNKCGVCESYSEAFHTLLNAVGIVGTDVVGTAGGGHKWSAVKLDGEWYMCDITFDDPIGGEWGAAYHYYFNRTSAEMTELDHDWSNCDWQVPECNGTKYGFKNYFNEPYYGW